MGYPIIIIGMHRSGTSLVARLLHEMGIYMGRDRSQSHCESQFFFHLNTWVYEMAHATWDNPEPMKYLLRTQRATDLAEAHLREACSSYHTHRFQGWLDHLRNGSLLELKRPWGWKDPRNTYTLPLWLLVFPNAKVLHIYRNGIDVVRSLQVREQNRIYRENRANHLFSCRCLDLSDAFTLWNEYVEMSFQVTSTLGSDQVLHVQYESLLSDPVKKTKELISFCGLREAGRSACALVDKIAKNRAYAFKTEPKLVDLYRRTAKNSMMVELGYGSLIDF